MSKVIVITGAGSGLGRALARRLVKDGDTVYLIGRTLSKLETVAAELGERAIAVQCDIGKPDSVREAFAAIAGTHPAIDVLINNAARIDYATLGGASDEHIVETVNTNLLGTLLCSRAAINMMGRGGHIINVSSEAVDAPYPHHVVYQATKGGIETASRHLQDELEPQGIRVTVVRAGPMMDQDSAMQASDEAVQGFYQACQERGIDFSTLGISQFGSTEWLFRALIDMPADMHVDTVRFSGRRP